MTSFWRMKGGMYLTLGIGLLLWFGLALGIGATLNQFELFAVLCVPTSLIPGVILTAFGMRARRQEQQIIEFASWVKSYRRVAMADLARKLGKTEFETDKILVDVIDRKLVGGFIDRQTNEFVLSEEIGRQQYVESCSRCGGSLKKMYPLGETVLCPYCGSVILGPPPPQPPQQPPPPPGYPGYYYPQYGPPPGWPPPPPRQ